MNDIVDVIGRTLWVGQTVLAAKGYKGNTSLYPAVVEEVSHTHAYLRFIDTNAKVCRECKQVVVINP